MSYQYFFYQSKCFHIIQELLYQLFYERFDSYSDLLYRIVAFMTRTNFNEQTRDIVLN